MSKGLESFYRICENIEPNDYAEDDLVEESNIVENELKALDRACQYIADSLEECPVSQDLIADLDCDNCANTNIAQCWKRFFVEVNQ